jgi:hypothetical protein
MAYSKLVALILAFSVSTASLVVAAQSEAAPSASDAAVVQKGSAGEAGPGTDLQSLKQELPGKKRELAKLHRKWLVAKGRTPTKEEVKKFEEKLAKGEATEEDNPFVNKTRLSNSSPARAAYFKKLEEVSKDEARIGQLERELVR